MGVDNRVRLNLTPLAMVIGPVATYLVAALLAGSAAKPRVLLVPMVIDASFTVVAEWLSSTPLGTDTVRPVPEKRRAPVRVAPLSMVRDPPVPDPMSRAPVRLPARSFTVLVPEPSSTSPTIDGVGAVRDVVVIVASVLELP